MLSRVPGLLTLLACLTSAPESRLPDDPLAGAQWSIENRGQAECYREGVDLGLLDAWEVTRGSPDVVVALLDTGCDLDHPDLAGQFYPRGDDDWNFAVAASRIPADSSGHGTGVAGLVAARAGNGLGMAGVAPDCRLMPLKVDGLRFLTNIVEALDYVRTVAEARPELRIVLSGSLSTGSDVEAVHEAIRAAHAAGVVLLFASGNGDDDGLDYPARYPETIAVGAIAPDGSRKRPRGCGDGSWGSNHGAELDVVAPGVALPTTDVTGPRGAVAGDYRESFGGTSAASPIAAAVAALMLSVDRDLTPEDVRALLRASARDGVGLESEDTPGFDPFMGWGSVDAVAAVRAVTDAKRFVRGDVDENDAVAIDDAAAILHYVFVAGADFPCPASADVDDDGRINVTDAIRLFRFALLGGDPPAPPFPATGFDPTPEMGLCL